MTKQHQRAPIGDPSISQTIYSQRPKKQVTWKICKADVRLRIKLSLGFTRNEGNIINLGTALQLSGLKAYNRPNASNKVSPGFRMLHCLISHLDFRSCRHQLLHLLQIFLPFTTSHTRMTVELVPHRNLLNPLPISLSDTIPWLAP